MEKIYLFDMGRVLKRSFDYESFYKKLNPDISYEEFGDLFMEDIPFVQRGEISDDDFFSKFKTKIGLDIDVKTMEDIYFKYTNDIYESTSNIIDKLKSMGKKVYLLSDLKKIDFKNLCNKFDINKFEKVYLSYEIGYMKDDLRAFKHVIDDLKVDPGNILFFDDNLRNVENAKKVGIDAYQVTGESIAEVFEKNDLFNK